MRAANAIFAGVTLAVFLSRNPIGAETPRSHRFITSTPAHKSAIEALWQDRGDLRALNLLYGSGGEAKQPRGTFTFIKEGDGGSSPKFDVVDERGNHWVAKLGEESQAETAATRIVWAAGYFTDDDYYLPELHIEKMVRLKRGSQFVSGDGSVRGVRLEWKRSLESSSSWGWSRNTYTGTREMNGLRVLMALINNWDLKRSNNAIYEERGEPARYVVSDLGATFGRTGDIFTRSKSNLQDYRQTKFIQRVEAEDVDFHLSSRPFFLSVFYFPNYIKRTKMQSIVKDIPRAHARWIGQRLGRLSADQIRDCFRAAGYSPADVEGFAEVVESRIAELNRL